jgi:hypothetical protein
VTAYERATEISQSDLEARKLELEIAKADRDLEIRPLSPRWEMFGKTLGFAAILVSIIASGWSITNEIRKNREELEKERAQRAMELQEEKRERFEFALQNLADKPLLFLYYLEAYKDILDDYDQLASTLAVNLVTLEPSGHWPETPEIALRFLASRKPSTLPEDQAEYLRRTAETGLKQVVKGDKEKAPDDTRLCQTLHLVDLIYKVVEPVPSSDWKGWYQRRGKALLESCNEGGG